MTETPDAITRFIDTTNRGDPDGFVATFTSDAHLDDWGRTFDGHDGVRSWDRTDNIGVQAQFELLAVETGSRANEYVATIKVTGNGYNGTGPMTFVVQGDLVDELRIG
jgi:hypothetical protein